MPTGEPAAPPEPEPLALPPEGDLEKHPVLRLYAMAAATNATGWLQIHTQEGALFQSAELMPEVDVGRVEEVLVIQTSYGQSTMTGTGADLLGKPSP